MQKLEAKLISAGAAVQHRLSAQQLKDWQQRTETKKSMRAREESAWEEAASELAQRLDSTSARTQSRQTAEEAERMRRTAEQFYTNKLAEEEAKLDDTQALRKERELRVRASGFVQERAGIVSRQERIEKQGLDRFKSLVKSIVSSKTLDDVYDTEAT